MHSKHSFAEDLHACAHVVFHEDPAVTAALIPVAGEPIAILERSVHIVAMVHHQTVARPVKTIEQPELLFRAAEAIARRDEEALREWHSNARVEVPLQDSMVASRLVSVVT